MEARLQALFFKLRELNFYSTASELEEDLRIRYCDIDTETIYEKYKSLILDLNL